MLYPPKFLFYKMKVEKSDKFRSRRKQEKKNYEIKIKEITN